MWIARDRDGALTLFSRKPERNEVDGLWMPVEALGDDCVVLPTALCAGVSWEDGAKAVKEIRIVLE